MATQATATRTSERELNLRMLAVDNAVAQQELEGLTVSDETLEDLRRSANSEIASQAVVENIHARLVLNLI